MRNLSILNLDSYETYLYNIFYSLWATNARFAINMKMILIEEIR